MASKDIRYIYNSQKIDNNILLKNYLANSKIPTKFSNINCDILCHAINNTNSIDTLDTSFRKKNILIDANQETILQESSKNIQKSNQGEVKKKQYTQLSIHRIECEFLKTCKSKINNLNNKKSQTIFSKKEFINENENKLRYNNISFKEINSQDKIDNSSKAGDYFYNYEKQDIDKNNALLSKNINLNDKIIQNHTDNNSNLKNTMLEQLKTSTLLDSIKNNIDNIEKNIFNKSIYKKAKIRKMIFNDIQNKIDNLKENYNKNNTNNKTKFDNIKNKYFYNLKKPYEIDKINSNKKSLLNVYLKNHAQIPKINSKLIMKNIQSLKIKKYFKNLFNDNIITKVCHIQSVWRGRHLRYIYKYFIILNKFINIISSIFLRNNKKIFIEFLKKNYTNNNNNSNKSNYFNYTDYLNHFKSNLNIISNEKFIIEKGTSQKEISKTQYKITNIHLCLICKKNILKEICHNESINIMENKTIECKTTRNKNFQFVKENQTNLNIEIKAVNLKLFKDCIIEEQKNNINIINQNKINNNEFNKDNKFLKKNSLLNIINQNFFEESINKELSDNQITLFSDLKDDNTIVENEKYKNLPRRERTLDTTEEFNQSEKYKMVKFDSDLNIIGDLGSKDFSNIKNKKNYNIDNEIDNKQGLEINPIEIKRTKNNSNNIFISNENKIQFLNNKESIITEKAKINMMKIIFPIRLKAILNEWIKKNIYHFLINKLKYIAFISHMIIIHKRYVKNSKKYIFEKLKKINILYYKNFYYNHFARIKIQNLLKEYAIIKWNKCLKEFTIFFINNNIK